MKGFEGKRCYDDRVGMAVWLALVLVYPAWADDRSEIGRVIAAVKTQGDPLPELFTADIADAERAYLSPEPLSEVTRPRIDIRSIRVLRPSVALVEAQNTQFGSLIMKRSEPLLLVLRKYGGLWQIACVVVVPRADPNPLH